MALQRKGSEFLSIYVGTPQIVFGKYVRTYDRLLSLEN